MKEATLVLIRRRGDVLLGRKKTGEIGQGLLNGPGGKREVGESLRACAVRETQEEVEVRLLPEYLEETACVTCLVEGVPDFRVYVYVTGVFFGEPRETESMVPEWHHWNRLPYERMHEGDSLWWPKALGGQRFSMTINYRTRGAGLIEARRHAFEPFPKH